MSLASLAQLHHVDGAAAEDVRAAVEGALHDARARGDVEVGGDGAFRLSTQGARFADRVARDVLTRP